MYEEFEMSANDKAEKVLRELHILLTKSEPYTKEPSKVIVDKQQMLDLLSDLNKCLYDIQDEYELTEQSRGRAEREFRKKGDQIVWDASRKAEDIYAASVLYTDEALNRVWDIMKETHESVEKLYDEMSERLKEQERMVKTNQSELKSQLQDLTDTEKYLKLIEDRNREIQKQKEAGFPKEGVKSEYSIYKNRQTEVKVNVEYLQKLGLAEEPLDEEIEQSEAFEDANLEKLDTNLVNNEVSLKQDEEIDKELEAKLRADLDADYFNWKESNEPKEESNKGPGDLAEGIQKMWKSIKGSKN